MSDFFSHGLPSIQGYTLTEQLYIDSRTAVYRATAVEENGLITTNVSEPGALAQEYPVVIKILRSLQPSLTELVQFRNQYAIAYQLNHSAIAQPLALERYNSGYALIFPDENLISLAAYWQQTQEHNLSEVLAIALQLTDALHYLSQQRVIHKDIKPANILIHHETQQVKLTNFGIASLLPREQAQLVNPNVLEGTLAYMSPAQTGRINRGIDYRTDYYSLGVTLYELLVGELPFSTMDPMELVHRHLASPVIFPEASQCAVPEIMQAIIIKLMAKNAEDGYQSALGLRHDLERCQQSWERTGTIPLFELGARDQNNRFLIPEKLYGRDADVQTLLDGFNRAVQGGAELLMVTGSSGIGKTALVNEIQKSVVRQRGYFIQGKFDQFNQNVPLSAFVQALRRLIGQLLGESDQVLALWKTKILETLGRNGQVILEVIPELEHIIGQQPPALELSGMASQNRFNLVFSRFVQVFTAPDHPLVIFLDDLQWVDPASLNLLKILIDLKGLAKGYLLVLGAYRDNDVLTGHPLMLTLDEMARKNAPVHTLRLAPLTQSDVNRLVADTLLCSLDAAKPLTRLVYQKVQGNPLFTTQFLAGLHNDGYITFDSDQGHWQCDLAQVQGFALTDDVVDYMVERLQTLSTATQAVLKIAACIGNRFDAATLAIMCDVTPKDISTNLWPALQNGLIIPESNPCNFLQETNQSCFEKTFQIIIESDSDESSQKPLELQQKTTDLTDLTISYRFLHDRVQQAAYRLIPENQTQQVHLEIGRRWLRKTPPDKQGDRLFEIISQLNLGHHLVTDEVEQQVLIQLNLRAAKQAIANTAYRTANKCLQVCRELLPTDSWHTHYDLTLEIYNTSVSAAYLSGNWHDMEAFTPSVKQQAQDPLDTMKVYEVEMEAKTVQGQFLEAITLGLKALASLGIEFPDQPDDDDFKTYLQETQRLLAGRSATEILALPQTTSRYPKTLLLLLVKAGEAAYNSKPELYALIGLKMMQISLIHGNMAESALSYASYGMLTCHAVNDIETGYRFGQAAAQLIEQFGTFSQASTTLVLIHMFISHWKEPIENTLASLQQAYSIGLETGELSSAGYAAHIYCTHKYFAGHELSSLAVDVAHYSRAVAAINQNTALGYNRILHQTVLNLLGDANNPTQLIGKAFDETVDGAQFENNQNKFGLWCWYIHKLILCYLFEDFDNALDFYQRACGIARSGLGSLNTSLLFFTGTLTCLALLLEQPRTLSLEKTQLEKWIVVGKEKLHLWATHNPHYYQHKYDLLCAESYSLADDRLAALEAYDQAIAGAKANGYLQDEALANELAAKFYLAWGKEKIAATYMHDAYNCYAEWGAIAKTHDLEQRYPQLLRPLLQSPEIVINPLETLASISLPKISDYSSRTSNSIPDFINQTFDFGSVLKAAQTLTETIQLDELLQKLSQTILQNSGGDCLILVLPDGQGDWEIKVFATPEAINICTYSLDANANAPAKLINYVKNTRELIYSDQLDTNFPIVDEYLLEQNPKSFLCAPLVTQDELTGILYLHSSTTCKLISSDRIVTLNFLFSQVATGLKNAQVFNESLTLKSKIIESAIDGIGVLENDIFIYLNKSFAALFGYLPEELLGKRWEKVYSPEELRQLREIALPECMETGSWIGEATSIRKDGSTFIKENRLFRLDDGKVICICRDISDRKRLEQEQKRLIQIFQATSDFVGICQPPKGILWQNQPFRNLRPDLKISEGQVQISELYPQWAYDIVRDEGLPTAIQQGTWSGETALLNQFGEEIPTSQVIIAHKSDNGEVEHFSTILRDISDRKAIERQLEFTQYGLDHAADCFYCLDEDARIVQVNQATCQRTGYTKEQLLNMAFHELTPTCPKETTWKPHWEKLKRLKSYSFESIQKTSTGELFPVEVVCNYLEFDGKAYDFELIRDITNRKVTEQALSDSQARIQRMTENVPGVIYRYVLHPDGTHGLSYVSPQVREIYELDPEEVLEDISHLQERIHPDDRVYTDTISKESAETPQPFKVEHRLILPEKGLRWIQAIARPEQLDNGDIVWDGLALDITDRKAAELALQESQDRFRRMTENVPGMIHRYVLHADGSDEMTYVDSLVREIFEVEPEAAVRSVNLVWERFHPDDVPAIKAELQVSAETLKPFIVESRLLLPQKGLRWIQIFAAPERLDNGDMFWDGVAIDISDRKQAEEQLKALSTRLELALKSAELGIWECNFQNHRLSWDDRMCEIYGISPATFGGTYQDWEKAVHPDDVEQATMNEADENPIFKEFRVIRPDGSIRHVVSTFILESDDQGQLIRAVGTNIDITDRKTAELALAESQDQFKRITENVPGMIYRYVLHADGSEELTYVSSQIRDIYEIEPDMALQNIALLWNRKHPDDVSLPKEAFQLSAKTLQPLQNEYRLNLPQKGLRWIQMIARPERLDNGDVVWDGVAIDISDRKQSEQQLQELSERLELALDSAQIGTWEWDYQNERLFWDERMFTIFGVQPENFKGTFEDWERLTHPDDLAYAQQGAFPEQAPKDGNNQLTKDYRIVRPDGTIRHVLATAMIQWDQQGDLTRAIGVNLDITDRKIAELSLQKSEEKFRTLVSNLHGAVYRSQNDAAWTINYMSDAIADLSGYPASDFIENKVRTYASIIHLQDTDYVDKSVAQALAKRDSFVLEYRILHQDGSIRWVYEKGKGIFDQNNQLQHLEGVIFDITDRKTAELALQESQAQLQHTNAELVRATRLKDEFLANMSHELRTPLNSILGLSEALQDEVFGPLTKPQLKYLKTIERSGTHLLDLINDILDVAKIEAGQFELDLKATNIASLCKASLAFVKQQAIKKRISLTTTTLPQSITLRIDERRILQSLVNLLNNAVKFTPEEGSVALGISHHRQEETETAVDAQATFEDVQNPNKWAWNSGPLTARNYIQLSVTDTGIGIAPDHITKLFKPFSQIDSTLNRKYMGTGLGLVLVKQMAELHGGTVSVTSEVGLGSCFSINLPFASNLSLTEPDPSSAEMSPPSLPAPPEASPLILLAEDNEDTISLMVSYLESVGYRLLVAKNGLDAIDLAQTHHPDLILMDIQMPELDGIESMQRLRQSPQLQQVPIIALTALAMAGDKDRCLAAGANLYLSKPVKLKQLVRSIQTLLVQGGMA